MEKPGICFGCMETVGPIPICPHCGYDQSSGPASSHHLPPGTILQDKYIIGKVLGQGGFGITYLAWDLTLDLKLAIREFFPMGLVARTSGSPAVDIYAGNQQEQFDFGMERFLSETKTLARFSEHPNIVTVRDFFQTNNTAYMVMNYIEGKTVEEYLNMAGGKISYPKMLEIILPIMDALSEVHKSGFMHRDVSPDNIYIRNDGRIILIDFGAARQELQSASRSLSVNLKIGYSPEEQYRSRGEQGPWTDIYAVAATIYRGITGIAPPEPIDRLEEDSLIPPSALKVNITVKHEQALLKALSIKAKDRFQSVTEFQEALLEKAVSPGHNELQAESKVTDDNYISKTPVVDLPIKNKKQSAIKEQLALNSNKPVMKSHGYFFSSRKTSKIILMSMIFVALIITSSVAAYFYVPISDLSIEPNYMTLVVGEEAGTFDFKVKPFFANRNNLVWDMDADKEQHAFIPEFGVIEPRKAGTQTISVNTLDGSVKATCIVIVVNPTISWDNGTYTGDLSYGIPHGEGIWTKANGESYEGYWQNGDFHGKGKLTKADGETFSGNFMNGLLEGYGIWTNSDGDQYNGLFINGMKHGEGSLTTANGQIINGIWENDNYKEIITAVNSNTADNVTLADSGEPAPSSSTEGATFVGSINNNTKEIVNIVINGKHTAILQPYSSIPVSLSYGDNHIKAYVERFDGNADEVREITRFIDKHDWVVTVAERF